MSYRGLKRVLGESSLERKCLFLFGTCLFSLIMGSFWWYSGKTENLVYEASRSNAQGLVGVELVKRHWLILDSIRNNEGTEFGGTSSSAEKKSPDEQLYSSLSNDLRIQKYSSGFIRPKSEGKDAPQDEFEWRVLEKFTRATPKALSRDEEVEAPIEYVDFNDPQKSEYKYYQAVRYKGGACIQCHLATSGSTDLGSINPGDLVAVAKIVIPNERLQRKLAENRAILLASAFITTFLAMVASYIIVRYVIVKPLRHLRDVSDEISHGNSSLRAEIHTGDEFEELATAFNRMLRHLTTVQDELRLVNRNLDIKVDELAQTNMQLYEMNRLKSDFLATMSHELRTPLNSIIGFSDVLSGITSLEDKQKRYVKNIQTSGKVLLEMINDILDLAKIESGKMELRLTDFRIEAIVSAQCDMARPLTERKNIDLETEIEPDLPPLFQDQAKVQQILNNLLSNAIKFTPEGGRIVVAIKRDEKDHLLLTVSDTGVGIAEQDQQAIFEKFRQGTSALAGGDAMTREHSGTGLGLSIVKELCKLLGGEISLESELGRGSTFSVTLPWIRFEQPKLEMPAAEQALASSLG